MKSCFGTIYESLDRFDCKDCRDFIKCRAYSKVQKEKEIFREIEKERDEKRLLAFLQKKYGYGRVI